MGFRKEFVLWAEERMTYVDKICKLLGMYLEYFIQPLV